MEVKMTEKILGEGIREQVKEVFEELSKPVKVLYFTSKVQHCDFCEQANQLVSEVAELSDQISVEVYDFEADGDIAKRYNVDKVPSMVIAAVEDGEVKDYGIRYAGIPSGHEFTSLIRSLITVSTRDSGLRPETRAFLADLDSPVLLQVFVTPSCPYCPNAVVLAHQMAFESEMVQAEMVEAVEFPDLSNQFGVSGVPHTTINLGKGEMVGAAPEDQLLHKIKEALKV
jgi:glutaredoxin-like protein